MRQKSASLVHLDICQLMARTCDIFLRFLCSSWFPSSLCFFMIFYDFVWDFVNFLRLTLHNSTTLSIVSLFLLFKSLKPPTITIPFKCSFKRLLLDTREMYQINYLIHLLRKLPEIAANGGKIVLQPAWGAKFCSSNSIPDKFKWGYSCINF